MKCLKCGAEKVPANFKNGYWVCPDCELVPPGSVKFKGRKDYAEPIGPYTKVILPAEVFYSDGDMINAYRAGYHVQVNKPPLFDPEGWLLNYKKKK